MKVFKSYVKNRNRPEGCIAENYTVEESIKFCVGYVERMEYIGSMHSRNDACDDEEGEVGDYGKALSSGTSIELDDTSLLQAHRWILQNTDEVQPWIE
jgi:Domain of unknown function (DUF4218)